MVRALASHQCVPGSILGPGVICGLSLLLVLALAPRVFLRVLRFIIFLPPQKSTFLNSNSIGNSRATGLSVEDCYVLPSLNKVNLFIYSPCQIGKYRYWQNINLSYIPRLKFFSSHIPPPYFSLTISHLAKHMLDPFPYVICLWFLTVLFFVHQVPLLIPIFVLLASIYLIVAPFYEAPLESFFCLLFILTGIPVYLVFVHFDIVPQSFFDAIGKFHFRFNLLNFLTSRYLLTITVHS